MLNTIRMSRPPAQGRSGQEDLAVTSPIPFFDGHNDFLLRLKEAPERREELWLGDTGLGHLDLGRMKQAGFAGGLFAIYVPSPKSSQGLDYMAMMKQAPFEVPLPAMM